MFSDETKQIISNILNTFTMVRAPHKQIISKISSVNIHNKMHNGLFKSEVKVVHILHYKSARLLILGECGKDQVGP